MELLKPEDPGYDSARTVWNGRFDSRPSLIARVSSPADVSAALELARGRGLPVTVKGGGHDYAGNSACDGGLLVDLGALDSVRVDPQVRTVTVGAGSRWGAVDAATQAHGLATTGGSVSSVGVAGFTLGGGQGWLTRKHGLGCDNLMAAQVVTASGEVVRASESENPDLLWGLRGGGANLGVVTSLELAVHPLDHEVLAGQIIYPLERAGDLLRFYRDYFRSAPDEVMCWPFFYRVPPLEVFPSEWHGEVVFAFVVAFLAPVDEGEVGLAPFREHDDPILDIVFPQSYVALQQSFDAGMSEAGNRWYTRALSLEELTDACIDAIVARVGSLPGDFTTVYLGPGGGAAGRVPVDRTAYPHRTEEHMLHIFPGWTDAAADPEMMAWARDLSGAVAPFAVEGVYVNMLAEDETERVPASYGPNHERLRSLKTRWDPENTLRSNHNVPPSA